MLSKLYDEIKKIILENYKFLIVLILLFAVTSIPLPYYVNTPGGIIDISSRIEVEGAYPTTGSFNMAYVSELKGTLPVLIAAKFNKDWDIVKKEEVVLENESLEDVSFRDHLMLEEANDNALILAYTKAGKEIKITDQKLFVTYVDKGGHTDLEIGDQIIAVNGQPIVTEEELSRELGKSEIGEKITFTVLNNGKEYQRTAELYQEGDGTFIGVMISVAKEIETDPEIEFHFDKSESGPSGGFMMSLAIYNYLIPEDITHGKTIVGTGTIDIDGTVGTISGIEYKLKGAVKADADIFLVPVGENYEEAKKLKEENDYEIEIVAVSNFDQALEYLDTLE